MSAQPSRTNLPVMAGLFGVFFLMGMSPGYYTPALSNILHAKGLGSEWIARAFLAGPVAALISPLIVGALADNRFAAQKLFGWISIISAGLLWSAFWVLDHGASAWWFIGLLGASSVVAAPMWSMLISLSMVHLKSGEREFPIVRVGGTVGWMVAGYLTSYVLFADSSAVAGYAGALSRLVGGAAAFFLPHTPPLGKSRSIRTLLGLDAFRLLKERDHLVFFSVTVMLSIPLASFYMHTPMHLKAMGDDTSTATMSVGQFSEIAAMLLMPLVMIRFRVKTVLMVALGVFCVRYGLFALAGVSGHSQWLTAGIALHGLGYTLYFITGQLFLDRRVLPGLRSQAQGLLTLASNGVGALTGTMIARVIYDLTVEVGQGGWTVYWCIQAGCVALSMPILAIFYRGVPVSRQS